MMATMPQTGSAAAAAAACPTDVFSFEVPTPPKVPIGGAIVQVMFAGMGNKERSRRRSLSRRSSSTASLQYIKSAPEYAGRIYAIDPTLQTKTGIAPGQLVLVFPDPQEDLREDYYHCVRVTNPDNIIPLPDSISPEVGAMLLSGALPAFAAIRRSWDFTDRVIKAKGVCNILLIGAGRLGLWAILLARYLDRMQSVEQRDRCRVTVADTNSESLLEAREHGCFQVVHWDNAVYEQEIMNRSRDAMPHGADVIMDFVCDQRTFKRSLDILNKGGTLLVGGVNSSYEISLCLNRLAAMGQALVGFDSGTREQLHEVMEIVANGKGHIAGFKVPMYTIHPVTKSGELFNVDGSEIGAIFKVEATGMPESPLTP